MKSLVFIGFLACSAAAFGQGRTMLSGGVKQSGGLLVNYFSAPLVQLPQVWVDNNELTCKLLSNCYAGSPGSALTAPAYTLTLTSGGGTFSPSTPSCTLPNIGQYFVTATGLQLAIDDMDTCRSTAGTPVGIIGKVPPGTYSLSNGFLFPQSKNTLASAPLIIESTMDSTIAGLPEPVCFGGIQRNVPESVHPGVENADCTGGNMYSQEGAQNQCANNCPGTITGITQISVTTTSLAAVTATGLQLVALTNGYVSPTMLPTTAASNSGCSTGQVSVDTGGSHECVTLVSGINQVGMYGNFSKTHSLGFAVAYVPDNDGVNIGGCSGAGSFLLANWPTTGACSHTANYNYAQYMVILTCSAVNCTPVQFCSGLSTDSTYCGHGVTQGPDHWGLYDVAATYPSVCGASTPCAGDLFHTGDEVSLSSFAMFAHDIHCRRCWANGGWTSLATGATTIASGFNMSGCLYCSVTGSAVSQALRPGAEGHTGDANGNQEKFVNDWFEGQSSCVFSGGFSNTPTLFGFVPETDVEFGRNRCQFPYPWLGGTLTGNPNFSGSVVRKNCFETKSAIRLLVYGLICDGVDNSGAQNGTVATIDIRNTSGVVSGANIGQNYQAVLSDWTMLGSMFMDACEGLEEDARGTAVSGVTYAATRELLQDILQLGISGSNPGCPNETVGMTFENAHELWNAVCTEYPPSGTGTYAICQAAASMDAGVELTYSYGASGGTTTYMAANNTLAQNVALCGQTSGSYLFVTGFVSAGNNSPNVNGTTCASATMKQIDTAGNMTAGASGGCAGGNLACILTSPNTVFTAAMVGTAITVSGAGTSGGLLTTSVLSYNAGSSPTCAAFGTPCLTLANPAKTTVTAGISEISVMTLNNALGAVETPTGSPGNCSAGFVACANPLLCNDAAAGCPGGSPNAYGFEVLNIRTGEPVAILASTFSSGIAQNCLSFNQATSIIDPQHTIPPSIGPFTTVGSAPFSGSWAIANAEVQFPWPAAGGSPVAGGTVDATGNCVLSNIEASPSFTTLNHFTYVGDAVQTIGSGPLLSNGPTYIWNSAILNSILLSKLPPPGSAGFFNSAVETPQEGANTEFFNYDKNTATIGYLVFPGRESNRSLYTEIDNNLNFNGGGDCPGSGCTPPLNMYFPDTPYATGATCSSNTVCFVGSEYKNATAMVLSPADYHDLALDSTSAFHDTALDGTDYGVRMSIIDQWQTAPVFICSTPCGSPGPFPE